MSIRSELSSSGHLMRDIVLGFALALLLPPIFYWTAHVIHREPEFADFRCQYNSMTCPEMESHLYELGQRRERATLEREKEQLKGEIDSMSAHLKETRQVRDKIVKEARVKAHTMHFYIAIVMGIAALLAGFFAPILPLEIGFVIGGILILALGYLLSWEVQNDLLKLISLVIAFFFIIAMSLKVYQKRR